MEQQRAEQVNAAEKRILLPLLKRVKAGETPSFRMRSAAEHLIYRFSKPASKSKKAARVRKEGKAATHREETARIREAVFQRADGKCELGSGLPPVEMHHLEGGSARRALQTVANCVAASMSAHLAYHRNPEAFREVVLAWCAKYGYPVPSRFKGATPAALVPKEAATPGSAHAAGTPSPEAPSDG